MRDPYDILGVAHGATLDEIKSAYRRACKIKHPDMGGSHEAMAELNTAYAFILDELKRNYGKQRDEAKARGQTRADDARQWERTYRDIDDELEELRRAAHAHEETLRTMRAEAWQSGERKDWERLTLDDLARFFKGLFNSGVKGVAVLFAALIGVGGMLLETNVVSGLVILGSGLGFFLSLAVKSDKGGIMSAALLLFGLMTIWLPPVRAALFAYPLATISVLICLALIFKFGQHGGIVGLLTGGALTLFVVGVIIDDTGRRERAEPRLGPVVDLPKEPTPTAPENRPVSPPAVVRPSPTPAPPEPRTLVASQGAILKFVAGVPYHLKIRTGSRTTIRASQGLIALYSDDVRTGDCTDMVEFSAQPSRSPYFEFGETIRACEGDALAHVERVE